MLLALIVLHLAAVLFYTFARRQNIVGPMVTGSGAAPEGVAPMQPASWWRLVIALLIAVGTACWLYSRL